MHGLLAQTVEFCHKSEVMCLKVCH